MVQKTNQLVVLGTAFFIIIAVSHVSDSQKELCICMLLMTPACFVGRRHLALVVLRIQMVLKPFSLSQQNLVAL